MDDSSFGSYSLCLLCRFQVLTLSPSTTKMKLWLQTFITILSRYGLFIQVLKSCTYFVSRKVSIHNFSITCHFRLSFTFFIPHSSVAFRKDKWSNQSIRSILCMKNSFWAALTCFLIILKLPSFVSNISLYKKTCFLFNQRPFSLSVSCLIFAPGVQCWRGVPV